MRCIETKLNHCFSLGGDKLLQPMCSVERVLFPQDLFSNTHSGEMISLFHDVSYFIFHYVTPSFSPKHSHSGIMYFSICTVRLFPRCFILIGQGRYKQSNFIPATISDFLRSRYKSMLNLLS